MLDGPSTLALKKSSEEREKVSVAEPRPLE